MCGLSGIYHFDKKRQVDKGLLDKMTDKISHRGPNDRGVFRDGYIGLGSRRVSIIDIDEGHQPMCNEDGSVWIAYNGELYNYKDLQRDLSARGHEFKTNCDTEVVVHAFEEWGPDCVLNFNGMFAFAIWDRRSATLFLARDRLGIKPRYYTVTDEHLLFASEIKSLLEHPSVKAEVELNSVLEYIFCTSMLNSNTMFRGIKTLPPGHTLTVRNGSFQISEYWDLRLENHRDEGTSIEQWERQIYQLLDESAKMRLMSDVPYGTLLSGGLDSSIITGLCAKHVDRKLNTFSIEFDANVKMNRSGSDTEFANLVADAFQTSHREFIVEDAEYSQNLEAVTYQLEKPVELTTPSLYLVHKHLKDYITVVLSGEGADELFGGYYFFLEEARTNRLTQFPWAPYFEEVSALISEDIARATGFKESIRDSLARLLSKYDVDDFKNRVLYLFIKIYLLEMLERQDKTSMAWGIEARVPFLDHRLVEYVANLPSDCKIKGDNEKFILKQSFRDLLPSAVINRKKKPFPFPIDPKSIIKQRNVANDLIQSGKSSISNYFDKEKTDDFFNKRNQFNGIDNLAVFRTSHTMIALERWHNAFGV